MSLKYALELLQIAHKTFEIKDGPFDKGKHGLTIENDKLMLTINTGTVFKNFLLDDNDLSKTPQDLILEIMEFIENSKKEIN